MRTLYDEEQLARRLTVNEIRFHVGRVLYQEEFYLYPGYDGFGLPNIKGWTFDKKADLGLTSIRLNMSNEKTWRKNIGKSLTITLIEENDITEAKLHPFQGSSLLAKKPFVNGTLSNPPNTFFEKFSARILAEQKILPVLQQLHPYHFNEK